MIHKDDGVRSGQGQAKSTDGGSQEEDVDAGIGVEILDDIVPLERFDASVQPHPGDCRHMLGEELVLDDVKHLSGLTEDQDSMLAFATEKIRFASVLLDTADTAIKQNLPMKSELHKVA